MQRRAHPVDGPLLADLAARPRAPVFDAENEAFAASAARALAVARPALDTVVWARALRYGQ